jgi:hypothetical protein
MAYKSRFRPAEILLSGSWRMLTEADVSGEADATTRHATMLQESAN